MYSCAAVYVPRHVREPGFVTTARKLAEETFGSPSLAPFKASPTDTMRTFVHNLCASQREMLRSIAERELRSA